MKEKEDSKQYNNIDTDIDIKNNQKENTQININNFFYSKLKSKLSIITKENEHLKSEIGKLKTKILNLEADKICQKHNINDLLNTQTNLLSLKNLIDEKEKIIKELKEQILSNHQKFNNELRYRESKYDYELIQSKIQYDSAKYKIENYLKI